MNSVNEAAVRLLALCKNTEALREAALECGEALLVTSASCCVIMTSAASKMGFWKQI